MSSKVSLRTLIVTSIPTLAALLGFLWFRKKKKQEAIEARKPAVTPEPVLVKEQEETQDDQTSANSDNPVKVIVHEQPQEISISTNNNQSNVAASDKIVLQDESQSSLSAKPEIEVESVTNINQQYSAPEEEIKVAVVTPMKSEIVSDLSQSAPQQNGIHTSSREEENSGTPVQDEIIEEEIIAPVIELKQESCTSLNAANTDSIDEPDRGKKTVTDSVERQVSNNVCENIKKDESVPLQNGSLDAKCEMNVNVQVRAGSHDSAVSMSSPIGSPPDSMVNGGTHNNCDAHSEVSNSLACNSKKHAQQHPFSYKYIQLLL